MKNTIKTLCLILILLLAGCSAAEVPETVPDFTSETENDFSGYEFKMSKTSNNYGLCYIDETQLADMALDRIKSVGEKYNCTISPIYEAGGESSIMAKVASASCDYDIYFNNGQGIFFNLSTAGVFEDLSTYDDILNFERGNDEKWGSVYVRELAMVNGVQYGLTPYMWPSARPAVAGIIATNETLITKYSRTDPRELVEDGTWTWDTFVNYIEDCTFNDGKQYYGFYINNYRDAICAAFLSNGCDVVIPDGKGGFTTDLASDSGIKAIEWAMSLYKEHIHCFFGNTQNHALVVEDELAQIDFSSIFIFHTTTVNYTDDYSYNLEDIQLGLVPFPAGPDGEYGNWAGFTYGENTFGIYSTGTEQDSCAMIISELCEPFEAYPDKDALLSYYMTNVFYDRRDAEFFLSINDNAKYTCNYWPVSGHVFWNNLGTTYQTATEFIEANLDAQMEIIEKHMLPNAIYIESLLN